MRCTTAGESHGRALVALVADVPAGIALDHTAIDADMARRQVGYGRGGRMRIETDRALVLTGVRFGRTIGSPVTLTIGNKDCDNWTDVMATAGDKPDGIRETAPRPGHADLAGVLKIGSDDCRDVLERASARETAARVAGGAVAKALLRHVGVEVRSYVTRIGAAAWEDAPADPADVDPAAVEASDVRCPDATAAAAMRAAIDAARDAGDSLGGVFTVYATGLVPGLGGYAQADQRLDARLAGAVVSIPAIKGVEFGIGFRAGGLPGSQVHDEITWTDAGYDRATDRSGGLEGGMTSGGTLWLSAVMKPIPTLTSPLHSVDLDTKQVVDASKERADVCAVPAAAVVAEAELALVLATAYTEKFGGDCVDDMVAALGAYRERIAR
ncbi:MAG: chorismate synthase [Actinomycetes bacterium]